MGKSTRKQTLPPAEICTPHLRIRLPLSLVEQLDKSRMQSRRTLTAEVTLRLQQSFTEQDKQAIADAAADKAILNFLRLQKR